MPRKFTATVLEEFKREAHLRTAKEHAVKYGSTKGSIHVLASKLKLKLKRPFVVKDKLYTEETFDLIRELAPYKSASVIASIIGSTPATLYNKCLAAGIKLKREKRRRSRLSIELGNKVVEELDAAAAKRNISLETLVRDIMNTIVKDKIVDAILMDEEEPERKNENPNISMFR